MDNRIIPAESGAAVTPSDATTFAPTRGLYIGASGNAKIQLVSGDIITLTGLSAGIIHPIACVRVYATDTTATGIIALR